MNFYTQNAPKLCKIYDEVNASSIYGSFLPEIEERAGGFALDIGSGSGRDASWLASMGYIVTAAEPNDKMRQIAQETYGDDASWVKSQLPNIDGIVIPDGGYDLIMCGGVMMHVKPSDRYDALLGIWRCLSSEGVAILNFRTVTVDDIGRDMFDITIDEITAIAGEIGFDFSFDEVDDELGRDISWYTCRMVRK